MKAFVLGVLATIAAIALFVFLYADLGFAPVATAARPLPFERKLASMALKAKIRKEAPTEAAVPATEENFMAGAHLYRQHCAVCHGLPGQAKTAIAQGMFPAPPQLFHGHGVTDDPVGETYWKVTNGIRLTGMPAFGALSETERWQVSQMLANADKVSAAVKQVLAAPALVQ